MKRRAFLVMLPAALAACAAPRDDVSLAVMRQKAYRHDGPPALTLYTMISNRTGAGAHTSLMVNAPSQRVIFDPAGSVRHETLPERNDVLYGITPHYADFYARAHARETYHVVIQRLVISAASAEQAIRLVEANGPAPQAFCANHTSSILSRLPETRSIRTTFYPKQLMDQFGALPGVSTRELYEDDADDKSVAIDAFSPEG
ncbi:hypothetical protein [Pseudaestuariivita sp.]|uniref:hypothetical protein n=1 Tax=Pseudaestuariivita sp. TaxID=2211669 RepID=UPI004058E3A3